VAAKGNGDHRYHHGNLRMALVTVGRQLLEESGARALSLREVARRAGVSHAAPGHHFASLDAFLSECASSGFLEFGTALRRARADSDNPGQAIAQMGRAYLAFAHRNPAVFRLMFDNGSQSQAYNPSIPHAAASYRELVEGVEAIDTLVNSAELDFRVLAIWSLVHGYADLMLGGHICDVAQEPGAILVYCQDMAARALLALVQSMMASNITLPGHSITA
jgi:AcrR family transcriptional regulator